MIEILGQNYRVTVGSDIQRDGMYLEVEDNAKAVLAEVFYSDRDNSMTFTSYCTDLPLPLCWVADRPCEGTADTPERKWQLTVDPAQLQSCS
jgi:hypothetical protein